MNVFYGVLIVIMFFVALVGIVVAIYAWVLTPFRCLRCGGHGSYSAYSYVSGRWEYLTCPQCHGWKRLPLWRWYDRKKAL